MNRYKNKALNPEEMRRRREEEGIQLRKQKREQQVATHVIKLVTCPVETGDFPSVFSELSQYFS